MKSRMISPVSEDDELIDISDWPDCPVEGCEFKTCVALNSDKCFHHTPGSEGEKHFKINQRYLNGKT